MTDTIEQKALALLNEARAKLGFPPFDRCDRSFYAVEALCRAIEQHEAYKREVSDAVTGFDEYGTEAAWERLSRFIIAKPDPLVEVISSALREGSPFNEDGSHDYTAEAKVIAAAIKARGGRIVWEGE